jgi:DNA polymerase-3 subunit beta
MKIQCNREAMLAAFQLAASVAPSRSPKPILQCVKLDVQDGTALLMATDLEVGVRVEVEGITAEVGGSAVLPVQRFGNILRESSDETLTLEADPQGTVIKGSRSEFNLPGQNPDEFPAVTQFEETKYHELPARTLKELIRRTIFATDTESSRYALGGVKLEMDTDKITAISTDGRRLSRMEGPAHSVEGHSTMEVDAIVPSRAMTLVDKIITDPEADIQICARGNDILFKSPKATIYSRLVEGRFPRWRDVFPDRDHMAIKLDLTVGPFYTAVRQAAVVTSNESRGIDFEFADGTLVLTGSTAEVGKSRVELPISYDGEKIILALDHRFVADFLRVLDSDRSITLEISKDDLKSLFSTHDGFGYVVMPLSRDR